jgi:uncharacterized protein (UPF0276 family)
MSQPSPFQRVLAAPVMGVGLGIDIFDTQPDFRKLIRDHRAGFDFLEVYSRGDWEHTDAPFAEIPDSVPRTYHHEGLDPVGPGLCPDGPIDGCAKNQRLLNPPWTVEELAMRHIDGRYTDFFFPALLNPECVRATVANLNALHARLPGPLLPENPPCEFVVGDMHLFDFMNEVAHGADCGLVLDLGHVWSYQLCVGRGDTPDHAIDRLDLSRVIEVHLAGARVEPCPGGRIYRDLHGAGPIPEESMYLLRELLPRLPNLKAITIEVEDATEQGAVAQAADVRAVVDAVKPDFRCDPSPHNGLPGPRGNPARPPADPALAAQYRVVYELMYKRDVLESWPEVPVGPLTPEHAEQVRAVDAERLAVIVRLHADDIGNNWYLPRFPATWLALQAGLECTQAELTRRFTSSEAFELREHDDSDGRALLAFIEGLELEGWLAPLLRYERLLNGIGLEPGVPQLERFEWDVPGIREALLQHSTYPDGEVPAPAAILLYRTPQGVHEAALTRRQAQTIEAILQGKPPNAPAGVIRECEQLLNDIQR